MKFDVRNVLRSLLEARETIQIQAEAVRVAQRRVDSTDLFLQAGRAEIRDLLEAQNALNSAQDALTSAVVNYRIGELRLQRDLGVLQVDNRGLWVEFDPETHDLASDLEAIGWVTDQLGSSINSSMTSEHPTLQDQRTQQ